MDELEGEEWGAVNDLIEDGLLVDTESNTTLGIFLFFGATMAFLAGITLTRPGTIPDRMSDLVSALTGDVLRGAIGFIIAGALLIYLLQPKIGLHFVAARMPVRHNNSTRRKYRASLA